MREDFVVAIGFSYNTEFKKKPLVFAVSDE